MRIVLALWILGFIFATSLTAQTTLTPATKEVGAGEVQYELLVDTGEDWTAFVDAAWVTVTPNPGRGQTMAVVAVARNPTGASRQATITIGSATQVITQNSATAAGYDLVVIGDNTSGQLGISKHPHSRPAFQTSDVTAISADGNHTHFIKTNGSLWALGENNFGQLGDGTTINRTAPVQIATGVAAVSAGSDHTHFIKTDGTLWAVGSNTYGQLGNGTYTSRTTPVQIATGVVFVSAGLNHTHFIKADGTLWGVGENSSFQLGDGTSISRTTPVQIATGVASVSGGSNHTHFVKTDGTLWATGNNSGGQLGDGTSSSRSTPVQITTGVSSVSAGSGYTHFIKTDGALWAMGSNTVGQLGDGTVTNRTTPVQIATGVVSVSAGGGHTHFIKAGGTLWATGYNLYGQLGDGTTANRTTPVQVATGVARVSTGTYHTHFIKDDASLWSVGYNTYGQLGDGNTRTTPIQVTTGVVFVSAGSGQTFFIKTDGSLWATGYNTSGQLGNGTTISRTTPVQVANGVIFVSAGGNHTHFIKTDGSLWAMGYNGYGQLGDGTYTNRATPVQIAAGVGYVSAGLNHTHFIKADGTLWAMGDNGSGQLGDGTTTGRIAPVQIATGVASVSGGSNHTHFVKTDGTLWAVGSNSTGQLGDATYTNRSTPVQIGTGVISVSAGESHSLFVKTDGSLWGMGTYFDGQLGNGTTTTRSTPAQIAVGIASVSAGRRHTHFIKADGSLWAMGTNDAGQLGDGSVTKRTAPVPIASGVNSVEAGASHTLILFGPDGRIGVPAPTAPTITTQPAARVVALGQTATFSVVATGTAPLSYQWLKAGSSISGANTAVLTLVNVSANDVSLYSVRVTNAIGFVESSAVSLTLGTLPVITSQPIGFTVMAGQSAAFYVNATGTAPLAYEWRLNGTPVSGATGSSFTVGNAQAANAGAYSVHVSNAVGAVTSVDAPLAVTASSPVITSMPASRSVAPGQATTFSVDVIGSGPLAYQWLRDGVAIVGATDVNYTLSNPQAGDAGIYSVTITNSLGSVVSVTATLTLAAPPPNDNFANAETMAGASTAANGTTLGATGEAGEPYHYSTSSASNSIWYRWTAPATGTVTIDTLGSTIDTVLAVYTGTTLGALTKLGSDDDSVGFTSRLVLSVQAGTTYSIAVGGYSLSSRGPITLGIALTGAPVITSGGLPTGTYGTPYAGSLIVATESPVSYGAAGLPDGITINPATGVISGTPTQAGLFDVTLSATNAVGTGTRHVICHIAKAAATVMLSNLVATHNGSPQAVTATTTPAGLTVVVDYDGQTTPPSAIGGYTVTATLNDANYTGSATAQLLIMANVAAPVHDYTTFAGTAGSIGSTDGTGAAARFSSPRGITVDQDGNVFVTDSGSQLIRKITPTGVVTVVAGTANESGSTDGTGSAARFFGPVGLTVDGSGNLYVAELHNHTIRKIAPGNVVTTLAGSAGQAGWVDGPGAAARFSTPNGLVFGPSGDLFVADTGNHVIRRITSAGVVTTYAGQSGQYGHADGPAETALFHSPYGLAVDVAGNLYVVETGTHVVRRITPFGVVSTVAGEPGVQGSTDGTGSAAHFREPTALTIDPAGTLFVADSGNHTIRAVTGAGVVSTVAGLAGEPGFADGQGSAARFNQPYGLALARTGQLYVADMGNHTIRVANIVGASAAPVISSSLLAGGVFGQTFENYLIRATGFPTSYGSSGLPAGLLLNTATGVISGTPTIAGVFSVTISATNTTGTGSATLKIVVSKANAAVTLGATAFTFDGTAHPATATTQPANLAVNFTYNGSTNAPAAAGTYSVLATINDSNYQGSATGTLTIARATATVNLSGLTAVYNGSPHSVTATTAPQGLPVILTYNGSEIAPTAPGSYAVEATIDDASYEGSVTDTLVINKAPAVVVLNNLTTTYNGGPQPVNVTTAPTGLTVNITYSGSSTPPTNAGSYSVTATVNEALYVGSVTGTLVINKAPATVTFGGLTSVYNGSPRTPTASTSPGGLNVVLTFAGSITPPTNAGTYAVTGTIDELNYFGSATDTFVINKAVPQLTWTDPAAITYGTALSATQLNASADVAGVFTYDPVAGVVLNAGARFLSVSFTPTDSGNYVGVATQRALTVNKALATVTLGDLTTTYNGAAKLVTATTSPAALNVIFTYDGGSAAPTNAGSYAIVATVDEQNYYGSATGTLVINKATPQLTWSDPAAIVYGTALSAAQLNAMADVAGSFSYTPSVGTVLNAGVHQLEAAFQPTDASNYLSANATRELTVNKALASVGLDGLSKTYTGASQSASATTVPAGLTVTFTYDGNSAAPTNAGSYAVEATVVEQNYYGSASGTLVINKATPQLTWSDPVAVVYGTAISVTQLNATADVAGSFSYTPPVGTVLNAGVHQLEAAFQPTDASNYLSVSTSRELTVNKALASVVLDGLSKTYTGAPHSATATTEPTGLTVTFTYDGNSTVLTNAGSYAVEATVVEQNYYGSASGTLVISKATPQITWAQPGTITYGAALGVGELNTAADVAGAFVYDPVSGTVLNAGTHTLTATFTPADAVNYTGASAQRTLTVNKAVATVTLGDLAATYDGSPKVVSVTTVPAGLAVGLTYAGSATAPTGAGSYAVEAVVNEANYTGSATATLVIAKAAQTIDFTALADRPFSLTPIALNATASSTLPVTFTLVSGPATLEVAAVTLTGAGTVTVRALQVGNANYLGAPEVNRSFVVSGNFASWLREKFTALELADTLISGPAADPDGDGLGNLMEYALGLEPKSADVAGLPEVGAAASDWTYTYTRPADRSDLTYEVEVSTNLTTWTTAGVTHGRLIAGATETWRASHPLASATNAFFRLKVSQQ